MLRSGYMPAQILKAWHKAQASDVYYNVALEIVRDTLKKMKSVGNVWHLNKDAMHVLHRFYQCDLSLYPFPFANHGGY